MRRVLSFGTDFTAEVSSDVDSGGKWLKITPLKPSGGAIRTGYLVLLTDGITDLALRRARPSADYATLRAAPADCSSITDPTANAAYRPTKAHLQIGQAVGVDPTRVVLSWSFTTRSIDDTFVAPDQLVQAQQIRVVPTGLTTQQVNAAAPGKANVYVGTTRLPYYTTTPATPNDSSILNSFWGRLAPRQCPASTRRDRCVDRPADARHHENREPTLRRRARTDFQRRFHLVQLQQVLHRGTNDY